MAFKVLVLPTLKVYLSKPLAILINQCNAWVCSGEDPSPLICCMIGGSNQNTSRHWLSRNSVFLNDWNRQHTVKFIIIVVWNLILLEAWWLWIPLMEMTKSSFLVMFKKTVSTFLHPHLREAYLQPFWLYLMKCKIFLNEMLDSS